MARAFQYVATSRSLYNRLRIDYQLLSIKTLTRITSKVSTLNETCFMRSVFITVKENQKQCVIMQDEIYVKKKLLYYGGILFGRVNDDSQSLAKTVLGVMISCIFVGLTFISKMLPIAKLNSPFLYEQIRLTIDVISQSLGIVKAVICDSNRNNQAFFRLFDTEPEQPWLTKGGSLC